MDRNFDLDDRTIEFAATVLCIVEKLPTTDAGRHIARQLARSGTAPALHYGEAQAAESPDDFIHKMKIALKELRETYSNLKIIRKMAWILESVLLPVLDENNQLISIFFTSIDTARKNAELKEKSKKQPPP